MTPTTPDRPSAEAIAAFREVLAHYRDHGPVGHAAGRFIRQHGAALLAVLDATRPAEAGDLWGALNWWRQRIAHVGREAGDLLRTLLNEIEPEIRALQALAAAKGGEDRYAAGYAAGVADVKRSPYYDDSADTKPRTAPAAPAPQPALRLIERGISVQMVREAFYCGADGILRWIKNGEPAGSLHQSGYIHASLKNIRLQAHRVIWALAYGQWPTLIDHINNVKTDNRIENLREATPAGNSLNRAIPKSNTNGYKGIKKLRSGRWQASIRADRVHHHIGTFDTMEEAGAAYDEAALKYHGEYARSAIGGNHIGVKVPGEIPETLPADLLTIAAEMDAACPRYTGPDTDYTVDASKVHAWAQAIRESAPRVADATTPRGPGGRESDNG